MDIVYMHGSKEDNDGFKFCLAIMSGIFPDDLVNRVIGHVHQARWEY